MPAGNVGPGVAVDLVRGFRTIGALDRESRRIRVGAGVVAEAVDRRSRSAGLRIPGLPSSADRCTVGGMVATCAAGAGSFRHGAIHRRVESLEVVLSDGSVTEVGPDTGPGHLPFLAPLTTTLRERFRPKGSPPTLPGWPAVRKNSSGYALDRYLPSGSPSDLLVGSEGTLALVTAVTLRLEPVPPGGAVILAGVRNGEALLAVVELAHRVEAGACEFFGRRFLDLAHLDDDPTLGPLTGHASALLLVELEGEHEEVALALERVQRELDGLGIAHRSAVDLGAREALRTVRRAASPTIARAAGRGLVSAQFIEDSVVPPARLPDYLAGLGRILDARGMDAAVFGHAGDGNVHVNPLLDPSRRRWRDEVREVLVETVELVAELGGTLAGEHGDGRLRAPFLERIWGSEYFRAFREVKDAFDPDGLLNPGVILPLPGQDPLEGFLPGTGTPPGGRTRGILTRREA